MQIGTCFVFVSDFVLRISFNTVWKGEASLTTLSSPLRGED